MTAATICIDGFNLAMAKGSGIATYARNLNAALRSSGFVSQILYGPLQRPVKDHLLNEIALVDAVAKPTWLDYPRQASSTLRCLGGRKAVKVAPTGELVTRQVAQNLPACDGLWSSEDLFEGANRAHATFGHFTSVQFAERAPDIMHWTCTLPLRAKDCPNLYTIHDLVPLKLPFATLDNKRRFLDLCRYLGRTADRIVTVSEHSRQDIVRILGLPEDRVAVTHQAVELPAQVLAMPNDEAARVVEGAFGLDWKGYFVFFGAIEPKKNLARLIEAYLASGVRTPLVVIGGRAWLDDDELRMLYPDLVRVSEIHDGVIRRADRIRQYDYLPFGLLMSLVRGARATLLPSLYEGFGLPVLESMLLGTPVMTSTAGSLPEVAGDAALLVDPYDSRTMSSAIRALDADEGLCADLAERGARNAARFSVEAYRDRLRALYAGLGVHP